MKKILCMVIGLIMTITTSAFANYIDIPNSYNYLNAINELTTLEIVDGYEDNTFKPEDNITRAEVAKMVIAAMGPSYTSAAESSVSISNFSDCTKHWANGYINAGVSQKFINGMGDGTFSPDTNVTYAQITKMLVAALGYTTMAEAAGGYPNGYIQIASSIGLTNKLETIEANTYVTRGQVAQLIANAIKTPIVAIVGWTTDVYGNPVAETEIMDGTNDSEKYQTFLTENHNVYSVKGRIIATPAQGTRPNELDYSIEYTDNFDGEKIAVNKNKKDYAETAELITAYYSDPDMENYLFTYSEALIQKDFNDEYHLISLIPYGRNDIVTFSTDLYSDMEETSIDFLISETSSKTKTYKLDPDYSVYVNNVEYAEEDFVNFIENNKIGTVTLIDTPKEGNTSKDGKYDYIMIDYQKYAVIDDVSKNRIFFEDYEPGHGMKSFLEVDYEDEDKIYSFVKNGKEIEFSDIETGDIALIKYDISKNDLNNSVFVTMNITDKSIEGVITSRTRDHNNIPLYKIEGEEYSYVADTDISEYAFEVGTTYVFYLDAKNRIINFDESTIAKNYGIIDKVWVDSNDEPKVRMIAADGTRTTYLTKRDLLEELSDKVYENNTLTDFSKRVVSYKINSKKEAYGFNFISMISIEDQEYRANTDKIGAAKMNQSTNVFDLSKENIDWNDVTSYSVSDMTEGSLYSFENGETYSIYYGDKSDASGHARVVIITKGVASVGVTSNFAVVNSYFSGLVDGAERYGVDVYTENGLETIYFDEYEDVDELTRGDVITYSISAVGEMKNIVKIFGIEAEDAITYDDAIAYWNEQTPISDPGKRYGDNWFFESGVTSWDTSDLTSNNGYARIGFGIILDRNNSELTLGKINNDKITTGEDIQEISFANDVNVYVYDFNERDVENSDRVTIGSIGSIIKTNVPKGQITEDSNGIEIYDWNIINSVENANYAFYKTIDGEITDILVIIPKSE